MNGRRPLAYFLGIDRGVYVASYPVWLVAEDPVAEEFSVAVDESQLLPDATGLTGLQRAYVERITRARLHQPVFRARVLRRAAQPDPDRLATRYEQFRAAS